MEWVKNDGEGFCYRFYGGNNPKLDNFYHGFDLGFIELLIIRVISDYSLIPTILIVLRLRTSERILKGKDKVS